MATQVIGGQTPNQESAIGAGANPGWKAWKVVVGLVGCVAVFLAVVAVVYTVVRPHQWTEAELNETFVSAPMEIVERQFGKPDSASTNPTSGQSDRLEYLTAVQVRGKPTDTSVTFNGENGRCIRVTMK